MKPAGVRDANFNLGLEVVVVLFLFAALFLLALGVLLAFNVVGLHVMGAPGELREIEEQIGPYGYLLAPLTFLIPMVFLVLAGVGLRWFFLRPDNLADRDLTEVPRPRRHGP